VPCDRYGQRPTLLELFREPDKDIGWHPDYMALLELENDQGVA